MFRSSFALLSCALIGICACIEISTWGNKIEFVNELGIKIDSLEMVVCNTRSVLDVHIDESGKRYVDENPAFPETGYPCPVQIKVYAQSQEFFLHASDFDCYHCDVDKYYILRGDSAIFQTHLITD